MAKRPTTMVMSVRCDMRDVAIIALWLNQQHQGAQNIGEIGRRSIELLSDMVKKQYPELNVLSTADAIHRIEQMGLRRGDRNTFSLAKQLQLEDAEKELGRPTVGPISLDSLSSIVESVHTRQAEDARNKEQMDLITKSLGGAVDGGESDIGEHGDSGDGDGDSTP